MADLSDLIGKHVFVRYFEPTRQTVLKGEVLKVNEKRLMLALTGNGPDFPDRPLTVSEEDLLLNPYGGSNYLIFEEYGDVPSLGKWSTRE